MSTGRGYESRSRVKVAGRVSRKHGKTNGAKENLVRIGNIGENIIFWTKFALEFYPIQNFGEDWEKRKRPILPTAQNYGTTARRFHWNQRG